MINAKTLCKVSSGAYVEVVPLGLLAKLQYNRNGIVEKILLGYSDDAVEAEPKLFKSLVNYIPGTIPLTGGTTWVYGVFYSDDISLAEGPLPECTIQDYSEQAIDNHPFEFYAGNVESLANNFSGSLAIRNWLSISKFNLLPGIIVPADFTEDTMKMMLTTGAYKFKYPYIAGYMEFDAYSYRYIPSNLCQITVKSVSVYTDDYGYILGDIRHANGKLTLSYTAIANYNITKGKSVCYGEYNGVTTVMDTRNADNVKRDPASRIIVCPFCNKKLNVPPSGPMTCDDPHCLSHEYPLVVRMLSTLKLPELSANEYRKAVLDKRILTYTDVLLMEPYKDADISAPLSDVIKAITPVDVCAQDSFFEQLAEACNQSPETLLYYMNNPRRAVTDMEITSIIGKRFFAWAEDCYNVLSLQTVLGAVDIKRKSVKIEGAAPIFRNNKFALTGRFLAGNHEDMAAIVASYSGTVISDYSSTSPDCVLVGGIKEGIDGSLIKYAKDNNIAILEEDQFLQMISAV